ncbi:unnamed protein product (macronuclear) [Paramecium tetraurelia]|uniref:Thioredoxin domain-containing protein n=1 Tax=Paramecium tetraurelia TaxID=5888 RepID=A0E0N2_PARTE|nr:uncharacterized protein GSPATT00022017001 [Paramecium tetraurelia]CAK88849.1 unnamed protein product [Paramecium tetraurelia]|eukprot:XP_001456246.1 hypothetical protein (macronuclear) [Paramecium tetraurelia strain d4-2]
MILVLLVNLILATGKLKKHHLNHQVMFKRESNVVILDADNFDAALMRFEVLLVDFYAPWCPHCQNLMPEFEKAATQFKEQQSIITLGKVDCTHESVLCDEFKVRGYPTLRIFYHDRIYHYHGDRNAEGIIDFMEMHLEQEIEKEQEHERKNSQKHKQDQNYP